MDSCHLVSTLASSEMEALEEIKAKKGPLPQLGPEVERVVAGRDCGRLSWREKMPHSVR